MLTTADKYDKYKQRLPYPNGVNKARQTFQITK